MAQIDQYVYCTICGHAKAPLGRSLPYGAIYCNSIDCKGYNLDPMPSQYFPNERGGKLSKENFDLLNGGCVVYDHGDDEPAQIVEYSTWLLKKLITLRTLKKWIDLGLVVKKPGGPCSGGSRTYMLRGHSLFEEQY